MPDKQRESLAGRAGASPLKNRSSVSGVPNWVRAMQVGSRGGWGWGRGRGGGKQLPSLGRYKMDGQTTCMHI